MYMPWCHKQHVTIILTHHYMVHSYHVSWYLFTKTTYILHTKLCISFRVYNMCLCLVLYICHAAHLYYISKRISGLRFASPMTSKCATCHQQYFIKMQIFWRVWWLGCLAQNWSHREYFVHRNSNFFSS